MSVNSNNEPHIANCVVKIDRELRELIPGFLENKKKEIDFLKDSLKQNDFESIRLIGHKIKGSAGGYGFFQIARIGERLEWAAKNRTSHLVQKWIEAFDRYMDNLHVIYCNTSEADKDDNESEVRLLNEKAENKSGGLKKLLTGQKDWKSDFRDKIETVGRLADEFLSDAVKRRADAIHVQRKESETLVSLRIDGDMQIYRRLENDMATRIINRFKTQSGMDTGEGGRPQEGTYTSAINNKNYKIKLSASSTPNGENLFIRLLDAHGKTRTLDELGMTEEQKKLLLKITDDGDRRAESGLILVAGPADSGKSALLYSLLSQIDCISRSLITVEDPIEYYVPFANQMEVDNAAGNTVEFLLDSAVKQQPDILFIGEVKDAFTAQSAFHYASSGRLVLTALNTSNSTTALFRLEKMGVPLNSIADNMLVTAAQRILKKLCPHCKRIRPLQDRDKKMLSAYYKNIPDKAAYPAGCPKCNNTGYYGMEGICEIIEFDDELKDMIKNGTSPSRIRNALGKRGDFLLYHHALLKIKDFIFSPEEVYNKILAEENRPGTINNFVSEEQTSAQSKQSSDRKPVILVAEDDLDSQKLIRHVLNKHNYRTVEATDGLDALLHLCRKQFDLVLADVNMPNMNGFKLLEIMNQKAIKTPVAFLTARIDPEDEYKGLNMGAVDYIKKPVREDILLLRLKNILENIDKAA